MFLVIMKLSLPPALVLRMSFNRIHCNQLNNSDGDNVQHIERYTVSSCVAKLDPALWGEISEEFRSWCFHKGPSYFQNSGSDLGFADDLRTYPKQIRKLSINPFGRMLPNGETLERK